MTERPDPLAEPGWYSGAEELARQMAPAAPAGDPLQQIMDKAMGPPAPVWNPENSRNEDDGCDVYGGLRRCSARSTWHVWIGCKHEHIDRSGACDGHIEFVMGTTFACGPCWERTRERVEAKPIKRERIDDHDHDPESVQSAAAHPHRQSRELPDDQSPA